MTWCVRFSLKAQDDLDIISDYIADRDLAAADLLMDKINSKIEQIRLFPQSCPELTSVVSHLRCAVVDCYLVL
jgi:plasmid stabilization system protein ParE